MAEVSFKPEMDMERGLLPESLIPTLSILGSDPLPITTDPMDIFRAVLLMMAEKMVKAVLAEAGHSVLMRRFEGQLNDPNQLGCLFTDAASRADPHPCGRLVEKQCWGAEHRRRAGVRGGAAEVWCCVDGKVSLSPYPPTGNCVRLFSVLRLLTLLPSLTPRRARPTRSSGFAPSTSLALVLHVLTSSFPPAVVGRARV